MRYHNITKDDMLNGDGLRVVLWVAGCSHACEDCHNKVTWDEHDGLLFEEATKEEIYTELGKNHTSGITFSGGDPLFLANRKEIGEFIKEIKSRYPKKSIWLYTGFTWDDIKDLEFIGYIDVIVDGRFELELKDPKLHWKGSTNQKVINVPKTLKTENIVLFEE